MHVVYFFSIDNFNLKGFWKMNFELRIKAKVSAKCIYECTRLTFWLLPSVSFANFILNFVVGI